MIHNLTLVAFIFQAVTTTDSGVNWLYEFTNNLSNLTTQNGGALTHLGMVELSFISILVLVNMVVQWSLSGMSVRFHRHPLHFDDVIKFLLLLVICCLLENYWVNPLPGTGFGFNHFFSYIAQAIVAALDQNSLDNLLATINTVTTNTQSPSFLVPLQLAGYLLAMLLLGLASAIIFLVNASSFIFYGVSALFGPLFIPLLMTKTFRGKFFSFLDTLLSFAMLRAVASAFLFVWSGFITGFITKTFQGNYSIAMWLANLVPVITVFAAFIFNMFFIPRITQALFGGSAGLAEGFSKALLSAVAAR